MDNLRPVYSSFILPKTVGDEELQLSLHSENNKQDISMQVELKTVVLIDHLSILSEEGPSQPHTFALEDVIVKYQADLIEKEYSCIFEGERHCFSYFKSYVILGIPIERYNWFLEKAKELTGYTLKRSQMNDSDEYTWVVAEIQAGSIECCVYFKDRAVGIGPLEDNMKILKASVVGVGHVQISVVKEGNDYRLQFLLSKFQLLNKFDISPVTKDRAVAPVEIPDNLKRELNLSNKELSLLYDLDF